MTDNQYWKCFHKFDELCNFRNLSYNPCVAAQANAYCAWSARTGLSDINHQYASFIDDILIVLAEAARDK